MELFKLFGTLGLKGVKETEQQLDDVTDKAEKSSNKFSKAFSAIGKGALAVGKTVATGLMAGATALGAVTVKAISTAGELEQNMGGSEAVFGEYAEKMQATAKKAFTNMGLSTSDYLATANKMGALFQGAGFDIEESMNLSSSAMQRAADVASIMGIDTSAAMEAVAGAAKGNFTMMDNLGVAMNETTLANYALEKGMSKSYNQMTQQEKIGLAMEMFLDKTSYATGNYAKENETLAGSLGTAKAAFSNFLSGAGSVDDVVSAFTNAGQVIVKNITELFPKLMTGMTEIVSQLVPMIPPLLDQLLPGLIEGATGLINGLVNAMPQIISALVGALPALIDGIVQIVNSLIEALPSIIQALVDALPTLIPALIDGLVSMIVTLCTKFGEIIQPIIDALPDIIVSIIDALMSNLPAIIQGLIQLVFGIVKALPQIFAALIEAVPRIFKSIWDGVKNIFSNVGGFFADAFGKARDAIANAFSKVKEILTKPFEKARDVIKGVIDKIKGFFNFKFEWPKLKLPKFAVTPDGWKIGDLLKGSIPKLSIKWNADGAIFDEPTIFPTAHGLQGVGEAGAEAVAPIDKLMGYVRTAVKQETNGMSYLLEQLIDMLAIFFPEVLSNLDRDIVFSDGVLAARLAPQINRELANIQKANERGR